MSNFSGGYSLDPGSANGEPLAALMRRYSPPLRVLASGARLYPDNAGRWPSQTQVDGALWRFALRVDPSDCRRITVDGLPPEPETRPSNSIDAPPPAGTTYFVTCAVLPDLSDRTALVARQREVDQVLDR